MAHSFRRPSASWILFCFVWIAGLVCGCILAYHASDTFLLLMRGAVNSPVSITGLLAAVFLPFLLIGFSVYISRPKLIYLICFFKACTFMTTGLSVMSVYGSAGWLVRLLLQFTDSASLVLLCWFACQHLDGSREKLWSDTALCAVCTFCLGCIDYCYVSPFLAMLIKN